MVDGCAEGRAPTYAKFDTICKGCGRNIFVGAFVVKRRGFWMCGGCDDLEEDELTASMARVEADKASDGPPQISAELKAKLRERMLSRAGRNVTDVSSTEGD